MEELEAKIRRPPTTYFISAHHVKAREREVSSPALTRLPFLREQRACAVTTAECCTRLESRWLPTTSCFCRYQLGLWVTAVLSIDPIKILNKAAFNLMWNCRAHHLPMFCLQHCCCILSFPLHTPCSLILWKYRKKKQFVSMNLSPDGFKRLKSYYLDFFFFFFWPWLPQPQRNFFSSSVYLCWCSYWSCSQGNYVSRLQC